jgi:hypothetical protein
MPYSIREPTDDGSSQGLNNSIVPIRFKLDLHDNFMFALGIIKKKTTDLKNSVNP